MNYNLKDIKYIIDKSLTKSDFDNLVFYSFPDVERQFTIGMSRSQQVQILLNYVETRQEIEKLLEEIKKINPKADIMFLEKKISINRDELLNLLEEEERSKTSNWYKRRKILKNKKKRQANISNQREQIGQILEIQEGLSKISEELVLVPYLANRDSQESKLYQVIPQLKNKTNKLLVCLVNTEKAQSHNFIERLIVYFFPRQYPNSLIKDYYLDFPENLDTFQNDFQYSLAKYIETPELCESNEEINSYLASLSTISIIVTSIYCNRFPKNYDKAIQIFLDFWEDWPKLDPSQHIFVFLFVTNSYKHNYRNFLKKPWSLFTDTKDSSLNEKLKNLLQKFSYKNFLSVVLPKLESIEIDQTRTWIKFVAKKYFSNDLIFTENTQREIEAIYDQWESEHKSKKIPMRDLALRLSSILYEYTLKE